MPLKVRTRDELGLRFLLATGFAGLLFLGLLLNSIFNPAALVFERADRTEYKHFPVE